MDSSRETVNVSSNSLCDLTQSYSFILQSVLGVLAFSTLILKRYCESAVERRPFWIWVADTAKLALGMLEIHFLNLFLSALITSHECIVYLVSFLLDSTVGLFIIYLLLKAVAWLVKMFDVTPLISGMYGTPFKILYWLLQTVVYMTIMFLEKLLTGPLVAFTFWRKVESVILPWDNQQLKIAVVIFIVPFIVNVVMFWVVDSILMWKKKLQGSESSIKVFYNRNSKSSHSSSQTLRDTHNYYKLCSSDSDTAIHDSNPIYFDSDLSESGEIKITRTS